MFIFLPRNIVGNLSCYYDIGRTYKMHVSWMEFLTSHNVVGFINTK